MLSACVIADPPEYREAGKTPPRLNLNETVPVIENILRVERGDNIDFQIPISSEDGTDPLVGVLHVDYSPERSPQDSYKRQGDLDASTLDEGDRIMIFSYSVDVPPGCHRLTLFVSHKSNYDRGSVIPNFDRAGSDLGLAVWWIDVIDPQNPNPPGVLIGCPEPTDTTPGEAQ